VKDIDTSAAAFGALFLSPMADEPKNCFNIAFFEDCGLRAGVALGRSRAPEPPLVARPLWR